MKILNKYNLPEPLVAAVKNWLDDYDFEPGPNRISVTSLIDSPYVRKLKIEHWDEIEVEITDMLHALKGSALHYILEKSGSGYINEFRCEMPFATSKDVYIISGKADLFDLRNQEIIDYKDVKAWALIYHPDGNYNHRVQLNMLMTIYTYNLLPVKKLSLLHFIKDWTKFGKFDSPNYPERAIIQTPVEVFPPNIMENLFTKRLEAHFENEIKPCSKDERWRIDKYKVMNPKGTRAVNGGGNFSNMAQAEEFAATVPHSEIKVVQGEDKRCHEYCDVKAFCSYYQKTYPVTDEVFIPGK